MVRIIKLEELKERHIVNNIGKGKIFIYPTDTIYGLGCDATNEKAVKKVREIKQSKKPFSVIAQSKQWIYKNFDARKSYIRKLPGPFTFILKMKKRIVPESVTGSESLGVRIPRHPFIKTIQKAKKPFITTSVNLSGNKPIIKIEEIPEEILSKVDLVIDAGTLDNSPSTIIDLTGKIARIVKR